MASIIPCFLCTLVSAACIRNITYVSIFSRSIPKFESIRFFRNAYNILYLALNVDYMKSLQCNFSRTLYNLRIVEFDVFYSNSQLINFECFFRSNPNIVFIRINNVTTWNSCRMTTLSQTETDYTISMIIFTLFLVLLCSLIAVYYFIQRKKHRLFHSEDSRTRFGDVIFAFHSDDRFY